MKVLLISSNITSNPYPVYPLGVSMIAGVLSNTGHEVYQFDFLEKKQSLEALKGFINEKKPDLVGISIRNIDNTNILSEHYYIEDAKKIVQCIRGETNALIILGGAGFSLMPEVILNEVGADYGIVGEGEYLISEFVNNAARNIYPEERCIRSKSNISGREIPSADYDPDIMDFYLKSGNFGSVQTKRGCSHKCVYCSYPVLEGAALRCRDPKAVVDDICFLIEKYNVKYIFFTDSVFNDDNKKYLDIVKEMDKRDVVIPWTAFFKPEGLDEASVKLMKKTGLKTVEIGVDAPSDITLSGLGKTFRFKDVIECSELFARHDIPAAHYYMFGCPGETKETVLEGINNIKNLKKVVSFIYMGIRIIPNTGLAELAYKEGVIKKEQGFLKPVYYIAPGIDKQWLEKILSDAFSGNKYCIFPPDIFEKKIQFLYKLGFPGPLWDTLISGDRKRKRKKTYEAK